MSSSLRSLTDDMERYHKAFGVFTRATDRNNVMGSLVNTKLREIFKSIKVSVNDDKLKEPLRVLSIGPGGGEIENMILREFRDIQEPHRRIHITVVEPAADMVQEYQERVATEAVDGMTYEWRTQTLDEYQQEMSGTDNPKFHFISSVQSIYYAASIPASLRDLYGKLQPGGIMLVVVISAKSGFEHFGRQLLHRGLAQHHLTSDDFEAACKEEDIPIADDFVIKVCCNITECFKDPKEMSEDGRQLIDFFTHVSNFLGDAAPELQTDVLGYLGSDLCSEKADGGQVYFHGDSSGFIVRRN